jgi:hypothetical protein
MAWTVAPSGSGTTGDPWQITTLLQLEEIGTDGHLTESCKLMNDIDASATKTWHVSSGSYQGFDPIGSDSQTFTGNFDGQDFTISNLYINRPTTDCVGLFAFTGSNAEIKDLKMTNAEITGQSNVGIFAGSMRMINSDTGTLSGMDVSGIVVSKGHTAGGLAGRIYGTNMTPTLTISDITVRATITINGVAQTSIYLGGITGFNDSTNATITCVLTNCNFIGTLIAEGDVIDTVNSYIGGLIGYKGSAYLTSCYSNASIVNSRNSSGTIYIGGLFGYYSSISSTPTSLCYATGSILSTSTSTHIIGGFSGYYNCSTTDAYETKLCFSSGSISARFALSLKAGGFCGRIIGGQRNCYSTTDVCLDGCASGAIIGGYVGYSENTSTTLNCYSVGFVAESNYSGGFSSNDSSTVTNITATSCYWDTETSGQDTSGDGTGKTTLQMEDIATFTSWDFDTIWQSTTGTQSEIKVSNLTVWLSKTGDYENYEAGTKDADSFQLTIPSTNEIRWIESMDSLVIGTAGDEWKIGSNKLGTPLTPTNFGVKRQTNYGSAMMQAMRVNEVILFVDYVRRKLREMTYDVSAEKFTCPDMTTLSEHITEGQIKWMAYQRNPDSILWVGLITGEVKIFVYDREQNVTAWANVPLGGNGLAQSGCVIPGETEDVVYLIVNRTLPAEEVYYGDEPVYFGDEPVVYGGGEKVYIEKFSPRIFSTFSDAHFVDCGIAFETSGAWVDEPVLYGTEPVYYGTEPVIYSVYDTTSATSTITGLDHLNGETVSVLGDGVVLDDEIVSGGKITPHLNGIVTPVLKAHVGLAFTSTLQPMRIVLGDSMGANTHVGNMVVSLLNTGAAKTGVKLTELKDVNLSDPRWTNLSTISGLFTGECRLSTPGNFDPLNPIFVSTDKPVPLTVRAMVPDIERTGR